MQHAESDNKLGDVFRALDLDGSGYIDKDELGAICDYLSVDELAKIFKQLDKDGDGRISIDDFTKEYQ